MPPEPNHPAPDVEIVPSTSPPGNGIAVMAMWLRRLARISSDEGAHRVDPRRQPPRDLYGEKQS